MANEFDYFPLYYLKLIADTSDMSTLEFGAYMKLLLRAWVETPPGSLPDDSRVLARYAGLTPLEWSQMSPTVLLRFETPRNGRIVQKRMTQIYEDLKRRTSEKSDLARQSAKARWDKEKRATAMRSDADAMLSKRETKTKKEKESADVGRAREAAPEISDGDELDTQIRAFIGSHSMITYDLRTHAKLKKLVECAGWERARELIDRGISESVSFPVGWALGVFQGDEQRAARGGGFRGDTPAAQVKRVAALAKSKGMS